MVNGYLLSEKQIDFSYVKKTAVRYILFCGLWVVFLTLAKFLVSHRLICFELIGCIFTGQIYALFHFWFLIGLFVIYCMMAFTNSALSNNATSINEIVFKSKYTFHIVLGIMSVSSVLYFVIRYFWSIDLQNYIIPPLRIITNGGYFVLGMYFKHNPFHMRGWNRLCIIVGLLIGTLCVFGISELTGSIWASAMYTTAPVLIVTMLIFDSMLQIQPNKYVRVLLSSTTIWILHPFIIRVLNKVGEILGIRYELYFKISMMIATFIICIIADRIITKIPYIRRFVRP